MMNGNWADVNVLGCESQQFQRIYLQVTLYRQQPPAYKSVYEYIYTYIYVYTHRHRHNTNLYSR